MNKDAIYRQDVIDALVAWTVEDRPDIEMPTDLVGRINALPPAQLDAIPLEWITKHLEWLDNCDNDFAQLAKVGIRAMVEMWEKDRQAERSR